jgi:hypothetical protein
LSDAPLFSSIFLLSIIFQLMNYRLSNIPNLIKHFVFFYLQSRISLVIRSSSFGYISNEVCVFRFLNKGVITTFFFSFITYRFYTD